MSDELVDIVEVIAEERIRAAMERGEFDNLPGKGRPLNLDDLENVPPELRAAYTLLRNAGFVPPEVALRKEIQEIEARLAATTDPTHAHALRAQIAEKEIVFDVMSKRWRRRGPR
jgi:hypothetical protein